MSFGLNDVKVGDKIVCTASCGRGHSIHTVVRLTKTRAVCHNGKAFLLNDGKMVGTTGYSTRFGRIPDADDLANIALTIRVRNATLALGRIKLSAATVDAAEALIKACEQERMKA
jgi:hypothetical protein